MEDNSTPEYHIDKLIDENNFSDDGDDSAESCYDSDASTDSLDDVEEDEDIIGIDLGTTNSCVGIWKNNQLTVIPDEYGNRTIPSIVSFTNTCTYVGKDAKNQRKINTENTYYETKRLIGRKYDEETVHNDAQYFSYGIEEGNQNSILLKSTVRARKTVTPEEIAGMVLRKCKRQAEDYLKKEISKAVITVPAYFNDAQREATKDAARIAGLDCKRIINEPTAAALAYGLEKKSVMINKEYNIIVYDLGGGTLDVSLLTIEDGSFTVIASTGNTHLGGSDFDNRIINYCINVFKRKNKINKLNNITAISLQKLKSQCENAKKNLSHTPSSVIAVRNFYNDKDLCVKITRDIFHKITRDLFILCLKPLDDILRSCDFDKSEIDEIILVGGGTRMQKIRDNIKLFFGKEPNLSMNPDEVVAAGAAIQAYIIGHKHDPFSESVTLLDIVPLSLGVEVIGGVMNVIIPRNSIIPLSRKRKYTTDSDYESSITIKIFEGERQMTKDNFFVGQFDLTGIEKAPRGIPEVEIKFSIDVNGIINVTATDIKNKENVKTITVNSNKGRLSEKEIQKIINDAKTFEGLDKYKRILKQFYYEIEDLCSNILINVHNEDHNLKQKDIDLIDKDVDEVNKWLKEKPFHSRKKREYTDVLNKLKKKFGVLILKTSHDQDSVKATKNIGDLNANGTSVYQNELDEVDESVFELLENEELKLYEDTKEEDITKIKEMREYITDLSYSLLDVLNSNDVGIDEEVSQGLRDTINDAMLWIHIKDKISIDEYVKKIEEINKVSEDLVRECGKSVFDDKIQLQGSKDELEQLCYTVKLSLMNNNTIGDQELIQGIITYIDKTLDWMMEIDLKEVDEVCKRKEENNDKTPDNDPNDELYRERIDRVNNLCEKLYETMVELNISDCAIVTGERKDVDEDDDSSGTSLDALKKKLMQK